MNRTKQKFVLAFLLFVLIRLLPGWISDQKWNDVQGMAFVWFGIASIVAWEGFIRAYRENQKIKKINEEIDRLKRKK